MEFMYIMFTIYNIHTIHTCEHCFEVRFQHYQKYKHIDEYTRTSECVSVCVHTLKYIHTYGGECIYTHTHIYTPLHMCERYSVIRTCIYNRTHTQIVWRDLSIFQGRDIAAYLTLWLNNVLHTHTHTVLTRKATKPETFIFWCLFKKILPSRFVLFFTQLYLPRSHNGYIIFKYI